MAMSRPLDLRTPEKVRKAQRLVTVPKQQANRRRSALCRHSDRVTRIDATDLAIRPRALREHSIANVGEPGEYESTKAIRRGWFPYDRVVFARSFQEHMRIIGRQAVGIYYDTGHRDVTDGR